MNGPVQGRVLVILLSRLIGLGRRNGHVFFFFSATAKLDPPWMFRSTAACILDVTFRRLKRWDLLWIAWVLLSLGSYRHIISGRRSQFVADELDRSG